MTSEGNETASTTSEEIGDRKARKTTILPDYFTNAPDQQWQSWLEDFELHAEVNGWDESEKCQYLALRLKRSPREVYRTLATAEKATYSVLKNSLTVRFQPLDQAELWRTQFRSRRKGENERLLDFGMAIRTLASRAFPQMPIDQRDLLARDQFIDGLINADFRFRVRHAKPSTLDDAIKASLELETIQTAEARRCQETLTHATSTYPEALAPTFQGMPAAQSSHVATVSLPDDVSNTLKEMMSLLKELV